jgi:hypothetical protein
MALSVADDGLDSVCQGSVWLTGHRPALTRGHAVAAVRWPWPHRSGRGRLSVATTSTARFSLHSSLLPPSEHAEEEKRAAAVAASSAAIVRAHRHVAASQTPSIAPLGTPPPPPSLTRANCAEVRGTLPFPPPRDLVGVRPRDGSPWPAQHRAPPLSLAHVPSSLPPIDALVMTLPQMPAKPDRNTTAHYCAMAADEVLMRPHYSAPSRSSLVASLGPPRLQGADASL